MNQAMKLNENKNKKNTCTIVLFVGTYPKNMIMFVFMVCVNINSAGMRQKTDRLR